MDQEKLTEEITNRIKQYGDLSDYKKNRETSKLVTLLSELSDFPKTAVSPANLSRVKNQVLDRISLPKMELQENSWFSMAKFFRIGVGALGSLMILISLIFSTAYAALNSVPGQAIYPLKQIVENIQLKLTPEDQRSNLQLQFANTRVNELQQVIQKQQDGQLSDQDATKIIADTVKDLQKTTIAAANSSSQKPQSSIINKLADLSTKLRIASVRSEGEVKIELEKALQTTQDSQEQAMKNMAEAGIKIEGTPVTIDDSVSATGKLTAISETYVSIGTVKFLVTKDTKYVGITEDKLAIGQTVDIDGVIKDNKTYAQTITLIADKAQSETKTETPAPDTTPVTP